MSQPLENQNFNIVFNKDVYEFVWIIKKLDVSRFEQGKKIVSPVFRPPGLGTLDPESTWQLWLYPIGKYEDNKQYSALFMVKDSNKLLKIQGYFLFESFRNRKLAYKSYRAQMGRSIGFTAFTYKDLLKQYVLKDKLVKIKCGIRSLGPRIFSIPDGKLDIFCLRCESRDVLSKDFAKLLEYEDNYDVTLKTRNKSFNAHKLILSARSPVFAAKFQNDTKEKEIKIVEIEDMKPGILEEVLRFIYTGTLHEINDNNASDFLSAARRYAMPDLANYCIDYLSQTITPENYFRLRIMADLFPETTLKLKCSDFTQINRSPLFELYRESLKYQPEELLR